MYQSLKSISATLLLSVGIVLFSSAQDLSPLANKFIESLSPELKKQASFPFDHSERFNWHFVPRERNGPTFHDFNQTQTTNALNLMRASLGTSGQEKAAAIIELENVLRAVENRPENDTYRDPLNYHFSVFGQPSADKAWGWRLEGHHLSLNFSSAKGTITSSTPSFMGSNPGIVLEGPHRNRQVLGDETNVGFQLLHSLNEPQKKQAVFANKAPADIITSNDRKAKILDQSGIKGSNLQPNQLALLKELVEVYLSRYTAEYHAALLKRIENHGWENMSFAWAGAETNSVGHPHYYSIQGAGLLIEYDNVQNNANHVHAVVRDLQNDFGGDLLQSHYLEDHLGNNIAHSAE
ncbi:DUF3500 domain-containing protein [uncultured Cyclobacterium sp.]|uniref:DUF3500 domain-containing protein n=1 Tax=uncultured Cyclobacterium sp. TaxID=453820 RepID=UPI0030EC2BA7|tara:strand:- start:274784 stop:275836 length:1053 start_codon:yes stop_codon:yes gene_type:complete